MLTWAWGSGLKNTALRDSMLGRLRREIGLRTALTLEMFVWPESDEVV